MRARAVVLCVALILAGAGIFMWRTGGANKAAAPARDEKPPAAAAESRQFELAIEASFAVTGKTVYVRGLLPMETDRQTIRKEQFSPESLCLRVETGDQSRVAVWRKSHARGQQTLVYSCVATAEARRFDLPPRLARPASVPDEVQPCLRPSPEIQSDAPQVRALYEQLVAPEDRDDVVAAVRAAFHYAADITRLTGFKKDTDDALSCLTIGKGACGGKSRLMAALCRTAGVPARTVGGLILKTGTWQVSHMWVEAWIDGRWVPFCPTNGHFGAVPATYLTLFYGDWPVFRHTKEMNFLYLFRAKEVRVGAGTAPSGK